MEDYKVIMTELLLQYYDPTPEDNNVQLQTGDVLNWFRGVIPNDPITEHDVFEILTNCGFTKSQKIIKKKIKTFEGDKENNLPPEYEEVEIARILVWNLYEKL